MLGSGIKLSGAKENSLVNKLPVNKFRLSKESVEDNRGMVEGMQEM